MHTREPTPVSAREMATGPLEGEESVCSVPRSPWFLGWKTWPPPFLSPLGLSASGPAQAPPSLSGTHPLAFCSPEKQRAIRWQGWGAGARDQPLRCFSSHPASSILAQGAASPVAHKLSEWVRHAQLNTESSDLQTQLSGNSRQFVCRGPPGTGKWERPQEEGARAREARLLQTLKLAASAADPKLAGLCPMGAP